MQEYSELGAMDFPSLESRKPDLEFPLFDYDTRRAAAAADPMACVMAFHIMNMALLATLCGVRVCPKCPDCECRDPDGSVANELGGTFGYVPGYGGSNELQSGCDLHVHWQMYVEWFFDAIRMLADPATQEKVRAAMKERYEAYIAHVCPEHGSIPMLGFYGGFCCGMYRVLRWVRLTVLGSLVRLAIAGSKGNIGCEQ